MVLEMPFLYGAILLQLPKSFSFLFPLQKGVIVTKTWVKETNKMNSSRCSKNMTQFNVKNSLYSKYQIIRGNKNTLIFKVHKSEFIYFFELADRVDI